MYWKNIELCNQLQKDQNQSKTWGWPSLMGVSSPWKCIIFCKPWWEQSNVIKVLRIGRRAQSMISCLIPETMLGTDFVWKNWGGIQKNQEKSKKFKNILKYFWKNSNNMRKKSQNYQREIQKDFELWRHNLWFHLDSSDVLQDDNAMHCFCLAAPQNSFPWRDDLSILWWATDKVPAGVIKKNMKKTWKK